MKRRKEILMLQIRIFSWSFVVVLCMSLFSLANAMDLDCLSQPSDHPCWGGAAPSFSAGAVDLAEAVNTENQRRMNEGNCSGLDHEGCLGVLGAKVYCWLMGCLTPPDEPKPDDPKPDDPKPEDPEPDDPSGPEPEDPKEEPHSQQADTAAEFVGMQSQRFNERTREVLEKLQPGSVVSSIFWENGPEVEVVLVRFLEANKNNKREYIAFLDLIDRKNKTQQRIVMGGQGNIVYALPLETFIKAIRNQD